MNSKWHGKNKSQIFQTFCNEVFAREHKNEIKKDPRFRKHFQMMCASIGVDPLTSSKGFWSSVLDIGDFYYELAVQVVEVCMAHADKTGGLMELCELRKKVIKSRGRAVQNEKISNDDIISAIQKLEVLGSAYELIPMDRSDKYLVKSIPGELSQDERHVLQLAEKHDGRVTKDDLYSTYKWEGTRSSLTLSKMIGNGLIWLDKQASSGEEYWVPSIFASKWNQTDEQ